MIFIWEKRKCGCKVRKWMNMSLQFTYEKSSPRTAPGNPWALHSVWWILLAISTHELNIKEILERFSRAGPRGRGREWAALGEHPLTWLLSNNRLEKVPFVSVLHTSSNRLLLSSQDKGCTPSVAHSLPLPLGPTLLNLWTIIMMM